MIHEKISHFALAARPQCAKKCSDHYIRHLKTPAMSGNERARADPSEAMVSASKVKSSMAWSSRSWTMFSKYIYYILSLFLAHYCILRVILLLSDYEANFGVNIFFYQSVQVIFYCMVKSHLAANISILLVH